MRLTEDPRRTSYRRTPVPSESEWGSVGHVNWWHGFHDTTDTYAYAGLARMALVNLRHPKVTRYVLHLLWWRWVHRACDTVDFHHYACTRDPYGKKLDDDYRWERVWRTRANKRSTSSDAELSTATSTP